jgi:alcohol dehydrogenase
MRTRSVYFTGPREVAVREREVPEPGAGEARVRAEVSAISPGTELLLYRDQVPEEMAADETIDALSGGFEYPLRYGYATVGVVESVGEGVSADWEGKEVFAFHPHESRFCAPIEELVVVPERIDAETAALLANAETAVSFALDGAPKIGERVAVYGQGVVGLLSTAVLGRYPLDTLVTVDGIEPRREVSERLGADASLAPGTDLGERFENNGDSDGDPGGADLAYELSGDPAALDSAIDATGYAGRIVIGSWYGEKRAELDLGQEFHRSRIRLQSSQVSTIDPQHAGRWDKERRLGVAWDALAAIDSDGLLTHRVPVERAEEAYRLLDERPEEAIGVLVTYD